MNVLSYLWRGKDGGKASPSGRAADAAPLRTESAGADVIASGEDVAPDTFLIKSISEPGYTGKLDRAALDRGEAGEPAKGDAEVPSSPGAPGPSSASAAAAAAGAVPSTPSPVRDAHCHPDIAVLEPQPALPAYPAAQGAAAAAAAAAAGPPGVGRNGGIDDFSSISTIISELQEVDDCRNPLERQVQQKLEKQNKRRFLQKGIRFNILIVGESRSGKTTLRKKMFDSWHLMEERDSTCGREYIYQISEQRSVIQVSVVEGGCCDFLVTHCQLKLVEYINRKKHRHGGPDERVHVCVYVLDPTQDRIPGQQAALMQKLSTVVNLVPVIGKCDTVDPDVLRQRRDRLQKEFEAYKIKLFDDWASPLVAAALNTPSPTPSHPSPAPSPTHPAPTTPHGPHIPTAAQPALTAPVAPVPEVPHPQCSADESASAAGDQAAGGGAGAKNGGAGGNGEEQRPSSASWGQRMRQSIVQSPLLVDCHLSTEEQDERYQLPRFDNVPPTSPDFLRMLLIEAAALLLIDRTKSLFYTPFYDDWERRNGRRALVGQLRQMGLVSAVAVGVGALLLRVSSR